jgi:hypothetical protein
LPAQKFEWHFSFYIVRGGGVHAQFWLRRLDRGHSGYCGSLSSIGESWPSDCDRIVTSKLKEAGALLGIKVLHHVVIGEERVYPVAVPFYGLAHQEGTQTKGQQDIEWL